MKECKFVERLKPQAPLCKQFRNRTLRSANVHSLPQVSKVGGFILGSQFLDNNKTTAPHQHTRYNHIASIITALRNEVSCSVASLSRGVNLCRVFLAGAVVSHHALVSLFCRISKSILSFAFIAATLASESPPPPPQPPFLPQGAVLGNVDTLEDMSPRVVFEYLASCADVTGPSAPLGSGCLLENYIDIQFPGPTWNARGPYRRR